MDRLRGDVDEPRPRLAKQREQEEEPLLVRLDDVAGISCCSSVIERDDDDRLLVLVMWRIDFQSGTSFCLERVEAGLGVLGRQAELDREGVDGGHRRDPMQ